MPCFKTPNLIEMEDHTYVVCTTNDNHQCVCGNVNSWFKSKDDLVDYIQDEIHFCGDSVKALLPAFIFKGIEFEPFKIRIMIFFLLFKAII